MHNDDRREDHFREEVRHILAQLRELEEAGKVIFDDPLPEAYLVTLCRKKIYGESGSRNN